ncbi:MAG: SCO family protein [Vicinamibacterales bacterium]
MSRSLVQPSVLGLSLLLLTATASVAQMSAPMSVPPPGLAATAQIPMLRDVRIDQKLDNPVPLDVPFVDESGRTVKLGDYFLKRPVVLVLAYYECPMLCTQVINATVSSMKPLTFNANEEFNVLVVSFDPGETPAMARAKRDDFLKRYARPGHDDGIHFLTGRQSSIDALTDAVGFRYAYDKAIDQYAHPAVMTVLTPKGHVSRYLFGIEFAPRDLRFALIDAASERIGNIVDQAMLFCYHYDPETGTYGFAIMTAVRIAGLLTVGGLGTFIFVTLRRDRRQARAVASTAAGTR